MVVSALISTSPTLLYFGQESGEAGALAAGFGQPSRTSIFDYVGVPAHQAWMNGGRFDGGGFTAEQRQLHDFYQRLMSLSASQSALRGEFVSLHEHNQQTTGYSEQQMSFVRFNSQQRLIVVSNFSEQPANFTLKLPRTLLAQWQLQPGDLALTDLLAQSPNAPTVLLHYPSQQDGSIALQLPALGSVVLQLPLQQ
jgi:glycosidase